MLRFVDISGQITEVEFEFAWYDTITDRFLEFSGFQTWHSLEDFEKDYDTHHGALRYPIERFRSLFPGPMNAGVIPKGE